MRSATAWHFLSTVPLTALVVLAGLAGTASGELNMSGTCAAAWCANDRGSASAKADALDLVREQLPALGCDTRKRLSEEVAVIPAPRAGEIHFDTTVVRRMPFDQAWAEGRRGLVYVVGWCS